MNTMVIFGAVLAAASVATLITWAVIRVFHGRAS